MALLPGRDYLGVIGGRAFFTVHPEVILGTLVVGVRVCHFCKPVLWLVPLGPYAQTYQVVL